MQTPAFQAMLTRGEMLVARLRPDGGCTGKCTLVARGVHEAELQFHAGTWYGPVSLEQAARLAPHKTLSKVGAPYTFEVVPLGTALYMLEREGNPTTEAEFRGRLRSMEEAAGRANSMTNVFESEGLWGFWSSDWREVSYGYETEAAARLAARGYTIYVSGEAEAENSEAVRFWRLFARPFQAREKSLPRRSDSKVDPLIDLSQRFACTLVDKLHRSADKYGYHDHPWQRTGWDAQLRRDVREHVTKGDPCDVAAYCAFAWYHGWSLTSPEDLAEVAIVNQVMRALLPAVTTLAANLAQKPAAEQPKPFELEPYCIRKDNSRPPTRYRGERYASGKLVWSGPWWSAPDGAQRDCEQHQRQQATTEAPR